VNIRVFLITKGGVYPMYFDSDGDGNPDTNVFALSSITEIALGFVDTTVAGQKGRAIPDNDPSDLAEVNAASENTTVPASASLVGRWGYGRLKHRNSGSWAAQSGVFIYNADGTGSTQWHENDNNSHAAKTFTWTWTADPNPDGSITLIRNQSNGSIKTRRIVISDDSKVMLLDGTDNTNHQRLRIAVRLDSGKTYRNSDLTEDYYNVEYTRSTSGLRTFSSLTHANGMGGITQTYTANDNGTVSTGMENHTYTISADGSAAIEGSPIASFYLSGDSKLLTGASSPFDNVWSTPLLMKKADKTYSTADIEGSWAFVIFGDDNGTSFFAEMGTMNCNSSGSCDSDYKQQRDGVITVGSNPSMTTTIQADGSFGTSLGPNTPAYGGALGNDGNTFLFNLSFEETTSRVVGIGVKCSACNELGIGGGPGLTRLTNNPANDWHPYYSPDGNEMVFTSDRNGSDDVWLMNADGSNPTPILSDIYNNRRPDWSPGGDRFVFESNRSGNDDIWIINKDGSGLTQLTTSTANDTHPAWSPDGTRIAFQSNRTGNNDIWVVNTDGTGLTQLTNNPANDGHPMWKPDGTQISFARNLASNDIWVMNADGTNQQALTSDPADEQHPAWSPDGKHIAFRSNKVGNYDVWVMDANGSNQKRITTFPSDERNPDWSPDGTKMVFRSDRTGNREIWTKTLP
jgi:Tol biopolymer transport system component